MPSHLGNVWMLHVIIQCLCIPVCTCVLVHIKRAVTPSAHVGQDPVQVTQWIWIWNTKIWSIFPVSQLPCKHSTAQRGLGPACSCWTSLCRSISGKQNNWKDRNYPTIHCSTPMRPKAPKKECKNNKVKPTAVWPGLLMQISASRKHPKSSLEARRLWCLSRGGFSTWGPETGWYLGWKWGTDSNPDRRPGAVGGAESSSDPHVSTSALWSCWQQSWKAKCWPKTHTIIDW